MLLQYEQAEITTTGFSNGYFKADGVEVITSTSKKCSATVEGGDLIKITISSNHSANPLAVPIVFVDDSGSVIKTVGDYTSEFVDEEIIVPQNSTKVCFSTRSDAVDKFNLAYYRQKSKNYADKDTVNSIISEYKGTKLSKSIDLSSFTDQGYIGGDGVIHNTTHQRQTYRYCKFATEGIKKIVFKNLGDSKVIKCYPIVFFDVDNNVIQNDSIGTLKNYMYSGEISIPNNAISFVANVIVSEIPNSELLFVLQDDYNELREKIRNDIDNNNTIVCVGDSLTNTYPAILQEYLGDNYKVVYCNKGGERPLSICARQGSIPYVLANDIVIPESGGVVVDFKSSMLDENGEYRESFFTGLQRGASVSPCYIANIEGTLSVATEASDTTQNGGTKSVFTFTRSEDGAEKSVYAGEPLITMQMLKYRDCKQIIFMGQNGGWNDTADLVEMFKRAKNFVRNKTLLIFTMHRGEQDKALLDEFGIDYLSLYDYFSNYAVDDAIKMGLLESGNKDDWRTLLIADGTHPNEIGTKMLAYAIYQRGLQIGMW